MNKTSPFSQVPQDLYPCVLSYLPSPERDGNCVLIDKVFRRAVNLLSLQEFKDEIKGTTTQLSVEEISSLNDEQIRHIRILKNRLAEQADHGYFRPLLLIDPSPLNVVTSQLSFLEKAVFLVKGCNSNSNLAFETFSSDPVAILFSHPKFLSDSTAALIAIKAAAYQYAKNCGFKESISPKQLIEKLDPQLKEDLTFIDRARESIVSGLVLYKSGLSSLDGDDLLADKTIVLKLLKKIGLAYAYISVFLQQDLEVVLTAVSQNGGVFKYMPEEFQRTREVALIAVSNHGKVLQCLIPDFKNDREVVLAAVENDGMALKYADSLLQDDKEIATAALLNDLGAYAYVSDRLKKDPNLLELAKKIWSIG